MDKKELLNELLEYFPELEKDEQSVEQALEFLLKKNPEVEADVDFKKNLKNRLQHISDYKMGKRKNRFWFFAIPSLSFLCIICSAFYMYRDMIFVQNSLEYDSIEMRNFTTETEEDFSDFEVQSTLYDAEEPMQNTPAETPQKIENELPQETQEKTLPIQTKEIQKSEVLEPTPAEISEELLENISDTNELEDTQLSDFIQNLEGEETLPENTFGDTAPASLESQSGGMYAEPKTGFEKEHIFENFERVCNLYEGVYDTDKNICTKNKEVCDFDDYISETCSFFPY